MGQSPWVAVRYCDLARMGTDTQLIAKSSTYWLTRAPLRNPGAPFVVGGYWAAGRLPKIKP